MTASFGFLGIAPAVTAAAQTVSSFTPSLLANPELEGLPTLVRPPPIIPPPDPVRLPAPEQPPILLLVRNDLRCEPLLIPGDMAVRRGESRVVPFEIICNAEAEFADDRGRIAAAVVVAGFVEIGKGGLAGAGVVDAVVVGVFEVTVVVVGGEIVVGQVLAGVARAPFRVLHDAISDKIGVREGVAIRTIIWICRRLLGPRLRAASATRMRAHAVG